MADKSAIEWTDSTWNPVRGCTRVSPGCGGPGKQGGCYAEKIAARFSDPGQPFHGFAERTRDGGRWTGKLQLIEDKLFDPMRWKKPRRIFVNSMSDLFHENLPDVAIDKVFAVMKLCPQHTFQVLTKRAERMRDYCLNPRDRSEIGLPNVWLGVSCERQQEADERIPLLLQTPAAVRFISAEPLLGPISLRWAKWDNWKDARGKRRATIDHLDGARMLDWVIVGGESGPRARRFDVEWADDLVDQCREADVACFVKQLGSMPMSDNYPLELKSSKGGDWNEWPERLRVRQMPQTTTLRSPVAKHPHNAEGIVS